LDNTTLILIGIGLAAGIGSGLFGIGGGVIIVPALVFLLAYSQHKATGTSLVILLPPVGLCAVMEYSRTGNINWKAAAFVAVGMLLGAWVGAIIANKLSGAMLRLMFGIFVLVLGLYTINNAVEKIRSDQRTADKLPVPPLKPRLQSGSDL
jgi:uncharacterized protein